MRLIDADALKKKTKAPDKNNFTVFVEEVLTGLIDEAPIINAVPIVNCAQCAHRSDEYANGKVWCDELGEYHECDWYCPKGEVEKPKLPKEENK